MSEMKGNSKNEKLENTASQIRQSHGKFTKRKVSKLFQSLLSVCLAFLTVFSTIVPAFAWTVDGGSGSSGGNGLTKKTKFKIAEFADKENVIAIRFSVYNKNSGKTVGEPIDVFKTDCRSYQKFSTKYNKMALIKMKSNSFSTTTSNYRCFMESEVGANMPAKFAEMKGWEQKEQNFNGILNKIGYGTSTNSLAKGDCILAEPLFRVCVDNSWCILTATEMAIVGAGICGGFDIRPNSSNSGGWNWIRHYSNGFFPSAMYLDQDTFGIGLTPGQRAVTKELSKNNYGVGDSMALKIQK